MKNYNMKNITKNSVDDFNIIFLLSLFLLILSTSSIMTGLSYAQTHEEKNAANNEHQEEEKETGPRILPSKDLAKVKKCSETELPYRTRIKNKLSFSCVKISALPDLANSKNCFDGSFFKVVHSSSDQAICFTSDWKNKTPLEISRLVRATTAYIHLNKAKNYFSNHPIYAKNIQTETYPITIRIDQENGYYAPTRFDLKTKVVNGAMTIAPSEHRETINDVFGNELPAWNKEIWFNKPSIVKTTGSLEEIGNMLNTRNVKNAIAFPFYFSEISEFLQTSVRAMQSEYYKKFEYNPMSHLIQLSLLQGIVEVLPQIVKLAGKPFKKKLMLDTAMFPEIIYHEYTHVVFGNYFDYYQFSALNEGIANYYASVIAGYDDLAGGSKNDYRGYNVKNVQKENIEKYSPEQEYSETYIFGTFTYSYFKRLERLIGKNLFENLVSLTIKNVKDPRGKMKLAEFTTLLKTTILTIPSLNNETWNSLLESFKLDVNDKKSSAHNKKEKKLKRKKLLSHQVRKQMPHIFDLNSESQELREKLTSDCNFKLLKINTDMGI